MSLVKYLPVAGWSYNHTNGCPPSMQTPCSLQSSTAAEQVWLHGWTPIAGCTNRPVVNRFGIHIIPERTPHDGHYHLNMFASMQCLKSILQNIQRLKAPHPTAVLAIYVIQKKLSIKVCCSKIRWEGWSLSYLFHARYSRFTIVLVLGSTSKHMFDMKPFFKVSMLPLRHTNYNSCTSCAIHSIPYQVALLALLSSQRASKSSHNPSLSIWTYGFQ